MARFNTVRERLLYEYAKLIARAACGPDPGSGAPKSEQSRYWGMVIAQYGKLKRGEISPSAILTENKLLIQHAGLCAYCGGSGKLHWEHIVPVSMGGPDSIDNQVQACAGCNLSKGPKDLLSWYGDRRDEIPRIVLGKYLKVLWERHESEGTLDLSSFPIGEGLGLASLHLVFKSQ